MHARETGDQLHGVAIQARGIRGRPHPGLIATHTAAAMRAGATPARSARPSRRASHARQPSASAARSPKRAAYSNPGTRARRDTGAPVISVLATRQVQVGDHDDEFAHGRYRSVDEVHPRRQHRARTWSAVTRPTESASAQQLVRTSCIVTADALITAWAPQSFAEFTVAHVEAILALTPELVILGTGAQQHFAPRGGAYAVRGARGGTRGNATRCGVPHFQCSGPGGAAGRRGAVRALAHE